MVRFAIALFACLCAGLPAVALECGGTDARLGLSPEARAELDGRTAGYAYPEGNHWRAERDGKVIDLVGTLHVDNPRFDAIMDRLGPSIEDAAVVLVEATAEDEAALKAHLARDPSLLVITDGPTIPELLSPEDWERVREAAIERGVPGFMAAKFRPWYLSILLGMPKCMVAKMQSGSEGLDARIMAHAAQTGVPVEALEPYDTIFRLFAALPEARQAELIVSTIPAPGEAEDMFAALVQGYFQERHAEIWALTEFMAHRTTDLPAAEIDATFRQLRRVALTDRNAAWIPVILDASERADGRVLVAAGAAHLSGDDGLLALLAARGFSLTRLPF